MSTIVTRTGRGSSLTYAITDANFTNLNTDKWEDSNVASATSKATPVDADSLPIIDSAASNVRKRLTWTNLKATLRTYFDTLYSLTGAVTTSGLTQATGKLLGRSTASTGAIEEIAIGAGLTLSAGSLSTNTTSGVTTVTLTSAAPESTLTSSSNQIIKIVTSGTIPVYPAIVLPDMTTLGQGEGKFYFVNTTPYVIALKSSAGVIRDYVPPYGNLPLAVTSIADATGNWYVNNPPCLVGEDVLGATQVTAPSLVNAGYTFTTQAFVRLSATEFAWVWSEYNTNFYTYAKLYTITEATRTVTAGNQVTIESAVEGTNAGAAFNWDCDFNGRALLVYNRSGATNTFIVSVGLTASGGTLSASTVNQVSQVYAASQPYTYCFYLGSNSAYAYGGTLYDGAANYINYVRAATVTGTTTLTQSASNTSFTGTVGQFARTSLTTATLGDTTCKYINYTPGANTFTTGNRTSTTARLDIEAGAETSGENHGSFGQRGFMYAGTSKVAFGPSVFDVTNVGTAGVTATVSAGFNAKSSAHSSYSSVQGFSVLPLKRAGLFTGGASISYVSCQAMYGAQLGIADTSGSTLDLSVSGVLADAGNGINPLTGVPTLAQSYSISAAPLMPRGIQYFSGIVCSSSLALLLYMGGFSGRVPLNVVFAKIGTSLN
jgi:hypothetical protein